MLLISKNKFTHPIDLLLVIVQKIKITKKKMLEIFLINKTNTPIPSYLYKL